MPKRWCAGVSGCHRFVYKTSGITRHCEPILPVERRRGMVQRRNHQAVPISKDFVIAAGPGAFGAFCEKLCLHDGQMVGWDSGAAPRTEAVQNIGWRAGALVMEIAGQSDVKDF